MYADFYLIPSNPIILEVFPLFTHIHSSFFI